ncbi:hypothetical protein BN59_00710 [Legionella massiliensis]|uniref:Uncharacterized protein n=1 Tax=Legionella massiliensis TaxID=1034943 RepID=A0A078KTT5_9GAMM|nr:hypothetical protein [Legionella massiliensis]CDZ76441.1 hypothetical protein BN59_00710 [Legionella massiliensis]CEE12179.1 hypothetical protein BN1094_00710 [Legionella massiliensis]
MFKKKEKLPASPKKQDCDRATRVLELHALDKKAYSLIKELHPDDPLRKRYASLPRKGCSKDIKKFERLEKELQDLAVILESRLAPPDEIRIVIS